MTQSPGLRSVLGIIGTVLCAGILLAGSPAQAARTRTAAAAISSPLSGATVSGSVPITAQISSSVSWVNFYVDNGWIASSPPIYRDLEFYDGGKWAAYHRD
jgi:Big-like domain-containing protein